MKVLSLGLAVSAAALLLAPAASAGPPTPCSGVTLTVDPRLDASWKKVVARLGAHLSSLKDIDRCARVELLAAGGEVVVHVIAADGRSAVRRVAVPTGLEDTMDALLWLPAMRHDGAAPEEKPSKEVIAAPAATAPAALPDAPARSPAAAAESAGGALAKSDVASVDVAKSDVAKTDVPKTDVPKTDVARAPVTVPRRRSPVASGDGVAAQSLLRFGAGIGGLGRLGGALGSVGGGGEAWGLFGWGAYWAGVRGTGMVDTPFAGSIPAGYHMEAGSLGIAAGRRFSLGAFRLDAGLGAAATLENQRAMVSPTGEQTVDSGDDSGDDSSDDSGDDSSDDNPSSDAGALTPVGGATVNGKVDLSLRLVAPSPWPVRPYGMLGASLWPSRLVRAERMASALPILPSWELTLSMGVAWESL